MGGKPIPDVIEYIKEYMATHENIEILVGSDSQRYGKEIVYGVVIVLYTKGHGGHVLCAKEKEPIEPALQVKLINEVWKSVEVAEWLKENDIQALIHYPICVHQQESCLDIKRDLYGLNNSEKHAQTCLSLPCHPHMSDADVSKVIEAINSFKNT